jgi:outer membrane protein assembly factor BamD
MLFVAGCASSPDEPELEEEPITSAQSYYELGLKELEGSRLLFFFRNVDYPRAIQHFQEVIDNYPYSDYATLAELKIADTQFEQRNYEEAASYYQDFVELHPGHDKVPYAIYRNGLCSFERMRGADRDQGPTREAISQFETLIQRYPDAQEATDARARLTEARERLAEQDLMIADFYYEQGTYHAAIRRYQSAIDAYPEHEGHLETLARIGFALIQLRQTSEAERVLRDVLVRTDDDDLRARVADELEELAASRSVVQ